MQYIDVQFDTSSSIRIGDLLQGCEGLRLEPIYQRPYYLVNVSSYKENSAHSNVSVPRKGKGKAVVRPDNATEEYSSASLVTTFSNMAITTHLRPKKFTANAEPATCFERFVDLPFELVIQILSAMLVFPVPIANPWLPSDRRRGPSAKFSKHLLPNILRTCRYLRAEGLKVLYGYNTFCFTRRNCKSWVSVRGFLGYPLSRVGLDLSEIASRRPSSSVDVIRRYDFVRKMIFQPDDRDSDDLASLGYARSVAEDPDISQKYLKFQFAAFHILELNRLQLNTLILTFDQEWLEIYKNILEEASARFDSAKATREMNLR